MMAQRLRESAVLANVLARVIALVSLAVATLIVARVGGPAAVGDYALMRVLPGLVGVVLSAGLPGAVAYFLASEWRTDPRLRSTLVAIALVGGGVGTAAWIAGAPLLRSVFFHNLDNQIVVWAGGTVLAHLLVATSKNCYQGLHDLRGANRIIVLEDFMFLPGYVLLLAAGVHGHAAMIGGLMFAYVSTAAIGWAGLARRHFFDSIRSPSLALARRVCSYGIRAQVGGVLSLLNLRLDFVILGALAGPATLGTYSVASKYAELLRLLPLAITYVLYPRYASEGPARAAAKARALIPKSTAITAAVAVPLAFGAMFIPFVYGGSFGSAVTPAYILLAGLASEGASSVATAFLYGIGRPGLNSLGMGLGLGVTLVLDIVLIPRWGAVGAAVASSAAYATTTAVLLVCFWSLSRSLTSHRREPAVIGSA